MDEATIAEKEKLAWCAISCAAACNNALNTRINLAATSDIVRNPVSSTAAADIPDFVAVDLCASSSVSQSQHPASTGQ